MGANTNLDLPESCVLSSLQTGTEDVSGAIQSVRKPALDIWATSSNAMSVCPVDTITKGKSLLYITYLLQIGQGK